MFLLWFSKIFRLFLDLFEFCDIFGFYSDFSWFLSIFHNFSGFFSIFLDFFRIFADFFRVFPEFSYFSGFFSIFFRFFLFPGIFSSFSWFFSRIFPIFPDFSCFSWAYLWKCTFERIWIIWAQRSTAGDYFPECIVGFLLFGLFESGAIINKTHVRLFRPYLFDPTKNYIWINDL